MRRGCTVAVRSKRGRSGSCFFLDSLAGRTALSSLEDPAYEILGASSSGDGRASPALKDSRPGAILNAYRPLAAVTH
jgi:hypothetical protein